VLHLCCFGWTPIGEKVIFVLFVLDSDFLNAYHVLVAMPHRKKPILFCSCMYVWCASVDVCMSLRICGFNLGFRWDWEVTDLMSVNN
jgi:hypothetical protein